MAKGSDDKNSSSTKSLTKSASAPVFSFQQKAMEDMRKELAEENKTLSRMPSSSSMVAPESEPSVKSPNVRRISVSPIKEGVYLDTLEKSDLDLDLAPGITEAPPLLSPVRDSHVYNEVKGASRDAERKMYQQKAGINPETGKEQLDDDGSKFDKLEKDGSKSNSFSKSDMERAAAFSRLNAMNKEDLIKNGNDPASRKGSANFQSSGRGSVDNGTSSLRRAGSSTSSISSEAPMLSRRSTAWLDDGDSLGSHRDSVDRGVPCDFKEFGIPSVSSQPPLQPPATRRESAVDTAFEVLGIQRAQKGNSPVPSAPAGSSQEVGRC